MKKFVIRLLIILAVAGAAAGSYYLVRQMPQRQQQVPTARVRKSDVVVRTFARGELRAVRSATLVAPNLFGTVQVTRIAPLGSFAKDKDLIVEFDDSELQSRLEEKQLELDQLDEQTRKAEADLAIRDNQDQVELLRARYSVRRAELEVKRNELISAIDAKKNLLTLEEARRRLKQLEVDVKSRREQAQAELAVLQERKNKAVLEMAREKSRLAQVKLLAPMSGLVAIRQARPMFFMPGMQMPDIREGDQLSPGMPVADVLDLSELEVVARVGELDRANLHEGQDVVLTLDALAEKKLHGKIKSMSGTASANIFSSDPAKKFDVLFSVDMEQLLTALGATKDQVARVMAQAEANRKRPPPPTSAMASMLAAGGGMFAGGGGAPGGGMGGGMAGGGAPGGAMGGMAAGGGGGPAGPMVMFRPGGGGEGSGGATAGAGAGGGGRQGGFGAGLSDEQRQKMREAFQKALGGRNMQDLTPEERQKIFAQIREQMGGAAERPGGGSEQKGERKGERKAERKKGEEREGSGPGAATEAAAGSQRGGPRAEGAEGREGGQRRAGRDPMMTAMMTGMSGSQFSEQDLANAKLPPPPEESDQLNVLLRPGLLADVEIIVEKIPSAIHIPVQGMFEKEGRQIVYVRGADGRFTERAIKPLKRSESTLIIKEGLKPGEVIALGDPTVRPGEKKGKAGAAPQGGGGAVGNVPGGKKGGF